MASERAGQAIERALTRAILTGSYVVTAAPLLDAPLDVRDARAIATIGGYRTTAAVEGGVAGAGGFWLAVADFPALIAIKLFIGLIKKYGFKPWGYYRIFAGIILLVYFTYNT